MDLSGVIFVVLALVWAAYLLPKALRHSDEVARSRSVDEVSDQARVVVTAPPAGPSRLRRLRRSRGAGASLSAGAQAARRRRRILGALLLLTLSTGVTAALGAMPLWAPVISGAVAVGFLVLCRVVVRRDGARRLPLRRTPAGVAGAEPVAQPVAQPVAEPAPAAPVGSLDDTGALHELVVGVPTQRASLPASGCEVPAGSLWDPLPVTLPTYVSKPRAMRSVRTISLGDPGISSSGRDAADSALVAGAQATAAQPGDGGQRVVGG